MGELLGVSCCGLDGPESDALVSSDLGMRSMMVVIMMLVMMMVVMVGMRRMLILMLFI